MHTVDQTCWCGKVFPAKKADVLRGWAKSCCKSHAAKAREKSKKEPLARRMRSLVHSA